MEISLAICGTAGRRESGKRLSRQHFEAAYAIAEELLKQINECNYPITHLVSGGAAYMDHIAVKLFLNNKVPHLRLFLPAIWENSSYYDNRISNMVKNPGEYANYYHERFQRVTGINSLSEIQIAKSRGAELIDRNKQGKSLGFYARNALVAKSDFLFACTFGDGRIVKEGGTADTVRKYLERVRKEGIFDKSFHYDLNSKNIYEGCLAPFLNENTSNKSQSAGTYSYSMARISP